MDTILLPPQSMIDFVGGCDFEAVGSVFLQWLKDLGGLRPQNKVLDVGCGCGRIAIPLTAFLRDEGSYEGFDIYEEGVQWCADHISAKMPNFRFQAVDVYNERYNKNGRLSASSFRFPYKNASFDFVFASSVMTHLKPEDMVHYLSEISRVLKSGGRCLITYFLFNEREADVDKNRRDLDFEFQFDFYRTLSETVPEYAIAFEEEFVQNLYLDSGLRIRNPVHYGFQDIVVAEKMSRLRSGLVSILPTSAREAFATFGIRKGPHHRLHRARIRSSLKRPPGPPEEQRPEDGSKVLEKNAETASKTNLPNGIWCDGEGLLHLVVQTYQNGECVVLATKDAREFVAFRGACESPSMQFENDVGQQGYTLDLQFTDATHGRVSARLPFGDFDVEMGLVMPASV